MVSCPLSYKSRAYLKDKLSDSIPESHLHMEHHRGSQSHPHGTAPSQIPSCLLHPKPLALRLPLHGSDSRVSMYRKHRVVQNTETQSSCAQSLWWHCWEEMTHHCPALLETKMGQKNKNEQFWLTSPPASPFQPQAP